MRQWLSAVCIYMYDHVCTWTCTHLNVFHSYSTRYITKTKSWRDSIFAFPTSHGFPAMTEKGWPLAFASSLLTTKSSICCTVTCFRAAKKSDLLLLPTLGDSWLKDKLLQYHFLSSNSPEKNYWKQLGKYSICTVHFLTSRGFGGPNNWALNRSDKPWWQKNIREVVLSLSYFCGQRSEAQDIHIQFLIIYIYRHRVFI